MKQISVYVWIAIILIFFASVFAQEKKPQWKGTIEEEGGIKVIRNPNEPLYGELEFELVEDLSIGGNKDKNYLFFRGIDFVVNNMDLCAYLREG